MNKTFRNNTKENLVIEAVALARSFGEKSTKYENTEAYNIAQDIRLEKIIPEELKSPVSLSKVFNVDFTLEFDDIYNKVVEQLKNPMFQTLE